MVALGSAGVAAAPGPTERKVPVVTQVILSSGVSTITSSTGHRLVFGLNVNREDTGLKVDYVEISLGRLVKDRTTEGHAWSFRIPASAVKLPTKGTGSIKVSSKQLSGYGKLDLSVKPKGKKTKTSCGGQLVSAHQEMTITGHLVWNTKSQGAHKWGTVGSVKRKFHFSKHSLVSWFYQSPTICPTPPASCNGGMSWSVFTSTSYGSLGLGGAKLGKKYALFGNRTVRLAHTRQKGTRLDTLYGRSKPTKLAVKSGGGGTLKIAAAAGRGTISSSSSSTSTSSCGTGSKKVHARYWSGSWKNGAHPLTLKAQVFGAIHVPNESTGASFSKFTVK
jgi:hypothetical protein